MTLKKLIQILQTHEEEMGDTDVHIIIGEYRYACELGDVDFCLDAKGNKYVHLLPEGEDYESVYNLIEQDHAYWRRLFPDVFLP